MIRRVETSIKTLLEDLEKFYHKEKHHFLTLNGVKIDEETTEIQWIFSTYEEEEITMFYLYAKQYELIPSVVSLLPSAIISQREIVDMFGLDIEDSPKGLYLDEDSEQMPLGSCGI